MSAAEEDRLIDPAKLIEYGDDGFVRFNAVVASSDPARADRAMVAVHASTPFAQSNEAGSLRPIESLEEACLEGQRIAFEARRIFS